MADICIVYASEDRTVAEKLYKLLSERWDAWWDDIIVGRFDKAIESEIPKAGCIVALFSASARNKSTVTDELRLGEKHGIELLPVRLDDSDPPYSFGSYSCSDLRDWNGEANHPGLLQLQRRLVLAVPPRAKPQRPPVIADGKVQLPTLFLSVSSHETQLVPVEALQALRVFEAPTILVSAYDLVTRRKPQDLIDELSEYRKNGGFVLLDSGNYEASRLGTRRWKEPDLEEALSLAPHDWAFCFDVMNPSLDPDEAIKEIVKAVERDRSFTDASVLPIIHAPNLKTGGYELAHIPRIVREVADRLEPELIAIPERELGPGLIARAKMVQSIREELNNLPFYQPLHILGTGNPWSVAMLAAAGADTFDGLEWCRMVVDRDKNRLHHFQHFDFFKYQTEVSDSDTATQALKDPAIGYGGQVAFHNLDYFTNFAQSLREAVMNDNMEAFMVGLTDWEMASNIKKQIPGIFK